MVPTFLRNGISENASEAFRFATALDRSGIIMHRTASKLRHVHVISQFVNIPVKYSVEYCLGENLIWHGHLEVRILHRALTRFRVL